MKKTRPGKRTVTITEIARMVGVSAAAVSVALSGRRSSTMVVGAETKKRILDMAKKVGYTPNLAARGLAQRRSYLIAMLGCESYFVFALDTIKGASETLTERDYALITFYDGSTTSDQERHLRLAANRQVDGLIIAAAPEAPDGPNHRIIADLRANHVPVVQLYRRIFPDVPLVGTSEHAAGFLGTRHLLKLGHRHIVHLTHGRYQDRDAPGTHRDAQQRAQGYTDAMREAGLAPRILTYLAEPLGGLHFTTALDGVAKDLLHGPVPATAVSCYCDYTAIGLIQALRRQGRTVPHDISVMGYDGIEAGALLDPGLCTLRQPLQRLGQEAARLVLAMMDGATVTDVEFQPELLLRGSTAPPQAI